MFTKRLTIPLICLAILAAFLIFYYWKHPLGAKVIINGRVIPVEVAVTAPEREKGLGYRDALPADTGMLFIYDHKEVYPFWMRGMRFPIDMIWIADKTVVSIDASAPVEETDDVNKLTIYKPAVPADKVLEVNAGKAAEWGINVGDTVEFKQ